jgi:hypothetical protein
MTADGCGEKSHSWEAEAFVIRHGVSSLKDIQTSRCGVDR